jgi:hypothetical protein
MKIKKAIKKIVALGASISMLGATLVGAAAYDLSDYPSPFVEDGVSTGLLIVGDDSSPEDIIGLVDIITSLQFSATINETIRVADGVEVTAAGDSVKAEGPGDVLEINEYLGDVIEILGESNAVALQSFTVSNDKGTTDVNQYLRFAWGPGTVPTDASYVKVQYTKDDDDNVGDFLWFKDNEEAFQYDIEFVEGFESDITDDALEDLEDETLNILGERFAVVQAEWLPETTGLTLDLMGGTVQDLLIEGETKTYSIKGKEYEVTALIVSDWPGASGDAKVKLVVNGKTTKELTEGETDTLPDGTILGIMSVLPNEAGELFSGDIIQFYLGAYKVELRDKYDADTWDGTVRVNGNNIEDSDLLIQYTNTSDSVKISKISYRLFTDSKGGDEPYIAPGQGLREKLDEPEGMLASNWDFRYEGLSRPKTSEIKIRASGDDEYKLSFTNTQGVDYDNVKYLFTNTTNMYYGDEDDALIFNQGTNTTQAANYNIKKDDYFVVSHDGDTDGGVTRVLQLESVDTANSFVQLTDLGTGGTVNAPYIGTLATCADGSVGVEGDINVGGYTFDFYACNSSTDGKGQIQLLVDLDDDGDLGGEGQIVTQGGGMIDLGTETAATYRPTAGSWFLMTLTTDSSNFDEAPASDEAVYVNFSKTSSNEVELEVDSNATIGLTFNTHEDNDDLQSGMTNYGVLIKELDQGNDPDTLEIQYPDAQLLPQAFITFEEKFTVADSYGIITVQKPQRLLMGSALLADQLSSMSAYNIISVGGPCINSITAELMGLEYPACRKDSGMEPGEGIIKLYENGDKVALVVAGWEAEDTTRATRILADYKKYQETGQLEGDEVKITGTSATDFRVKSVS